MSGPVGDDAAAATRLSIVVPALDEEATIGASLAALQPLRIAGAEVVVVDGDSSDRTLAIATPLADRALHAPRGRAAQMNAGAAIARGDVLLFLHADTRLPAAAVEAMARALRAGHRWGRFDAAIRGESALLPAVSALMNLRSLATGIVTGDQAMFMTREAFARVGGFPALPLMEDIAMSAALKRAFGRPARLHERVVTSGRRWDSRGPLRTIVSMWHLRFEFWRGVDPARLARRYAAAAHPAPCLHVFAKAPVAGRVKTRLAMHVGDVAAVLVYRELAERTLATAVAARAAGVVSDVVLWCDPDPALPAFEAWGRRFGVARRAQRGGDLGERMRNALRTSLERGSTSLLIGTDAPAIDVAYLAQAAAALERHDAVIGPAEDGGYVLVGLARDADIFSGIRWSTGEVMAVTRANITRGGIDACELPPSWDVDTAADLARYRALRRLVGATAAPRA